MDQRAQWMDHMSMSKTDKVLLGITVTIATVTAASVRLWMGFPVLVIGIIASLLLVRLLSVPAQQGRKSPADAYSSSFVDELGEEHRRLNEDLDTDPINRHWVGNIWHRILRD
jgi:hypothetical protein